MEWYFGILIVIAGFLFMEFMAWFTHKYVMHGFLWVLHKDHHIRDGRKFEWNDVFAVIFAIPSIVLIYLGYSDFDFRFCGAADFSEQRVFHGRQPPDARPWFFLL